MVEGRLRYHIKGQFKKCPEINCLMSSADSSWSGFLVERQKCDARRLSVPVSVYNPRLLVVTRGGGPMKPSVVDQGRGKGSRAQAANAFLRGTRHGITHPRGAVSCR